jgi:lipoprotein-anchoring transpeptidase ErfK/SrfK
MRRLAPLLLLVLLAGCGGGDKRAAPPVVAVPSAVPTTTPEPVAPVSPSAPAPAPVPRFATARPAARVELREQPGGRALGRIGPWTEFGSPRIVSVVERRGNWLRVVVPERPNGATAWIPARGTELGGTDVAVVVDRSARILTVRRAGRKLLRITVGVGRPEHPTPLGRYAVTDKLLMEGPGSDYGCCALALTGHQPHLPQGWTGLDRLAVHGTNRPWTIGAASSLGCLHASDRDLRRLMRVVPLGAPVFVRA